MPELEKRIAISIPHFEYICHGCEAFKGVFVGYRMIKGERLTRDMFKQICSDELSQKFSHQIAEFLSDLHSFPAGKARELGVPAGKWQNQWAELYADIQVKVFPFLDAKERKWTRELFEAFLNNERNFQFEPVLIHGDLSLDHILFDKEKGEIVGIVDFGDATIGDPAYDFQCLLDFGEEFFLKVLSSYELKIDPTFAQRITTFYARRVPFHEILLGLQCREKGHVEKGLEDLRKIVGLDLLRTEPLRARGARGYQYLSLENK